MEYDKLYYSVFPAQQLKNHSRAAKKVWRPACDLRTALWLCLLWVPLLIISVLNICPTVRPSTPIPTVTFYVIFPKPLPSILPCVFSDLSLTSWYTHIPRCCCTWVRYYVIFFLGNWFLRNFVFLVVCQFYDRGSLDRISLDRIS